MSTSAGTGVGVGVAVGVGVRVAVAAGEGVNVGVSVARPRPGKICPSAHPARIAVIPSIASKPIQVRLMQVFIPTIITIPSADVNGVFSE